MPAMTTAATAATARTAAGTPATTGATALYNAGSEALGGGNLGEAVLYLRAASKLDPRAADISRNLSIAEARAALERGEGADRFASGPAWALSGGEAWLLAALLIAVGAAGMAWRWKRLGRIDGHALAFPGSAPAPGGSRRSPSAIARRAFDVAGVAGFLLAAWLAVAALQESWSPEAVVLEPSLTLTAASGQPLPDSPALVAGEIVRLGPEKEGLVEVRLEGTRVGWVRRSGVWRVTEVSRYTPPSLRERSDRRGGSNG